MRRHQKRQCLEFVDTLAEAREEIKKHIAAGEFETASGLLAECQQGAITLGNLIESLEGEGTAAVSELEAYCETVWQIGEELAGKAETENIGSDVQVPGNGPSKMAAGIGKRLRKALLSVENSIKNDIPERTEAVFLPYKASMWDSLESVWRAAEEDPDCDAYVIPIPYYDKNPDGSPGKVHYEREEYPEDVPTVFYNDYDFAEHHPDMIFIHNSYDNSNLVTTVHPFFYSSNLKQYTDRLVYIPYYVLGEPDPENEERLERIEHFILVPAVLNADRVIVQSEAMRQAYINVLTKHVGKESRAVWEEKILGLGSPKFDRVAETSRENVTVPKEWENILRKPDGSRRKVIFYNTSVTALLEHGEDMLKKIRDVLRVFRENADEVALLWRPHPLMEATIGSMRPQLWEEYQKTVEEYRAAGWGIWDDTADLERAIALSDGYYGDPSSVVQLCKKAGMPVMIQNCEVLNG